MSCYNYEYSNELHWTSADHLHMHGCRMLSIILTMMGVQHCDSEPCKYFIDLRNACRRIVIIYKGVTEMLWQCQ